ncbi:hypothetical protein AS196_12850 [Bacillus sp. TH007]|nr:hypothetical protein AS196_12850 [Bacillus sp. TH007]
MSAWIEIPSNLRYFNAAHIALYVSAWIEIKKMYHGCHEYRVALYMSVWINNYEKHNFASQ